MAEMTEAEARYIQRLPGQLERARARVLGLEAAVRRYRMNDLLTDPQHANRAWDDAIESAQDSALVRGGSIGFADRQP